MQSHTNRRVRDQNSDLIFLNQAKDKPIQEQSNQYRYQHYPDYLGGITELPAHGEKKAQADSGLDQFGGNCSVPAESPAEFDARHYGGQGSWENYR